ncbi:Small GTPase superfamily Rho type [Penicillium coprophilum]|uniref:Small GTPase superfamily Rho type n=1 Tax=Penicillium coprophilum TaxID=36646 RepID=UPI002398A262|nr:Small GTPase superfamily Rho type [Penicillium coprophilum]KAJ5155021.1 Small GTPase superfamily Rho type [Penicillium coprophilum]
MAEIDPHPENAKSVSLLLLGDAGCGKSTFLARLKSGRPSSSGPSNTDQNTLEKFTLELYDTSNPNQHWTNLRPDVVVMAFDISNRDTLDGLKQWRNDITRYFQYGHGERLPVMMLGLKRDLRREGEGIIYPQEAYRIAQELRCDRYAECSAVTGELLAETFEDLARLAAMATTEKGGQSEGPSCVIL